MPLDWSPYDAFDWANSSQSPLPAQERRDLEQLAARILSLSAADRDAVWGSASPPGRFAATVIRIGSAAHQFTDEAQRLGIATVGLKLFKTNPDTLRETRQLIPFHQGILSRLPGLPNPRVQRSIAAGHSQENRAYVVQEWVEGVSLEDLRRRWLLNPPAGKIILSMLRQLYGGLVFPLWRAGTIWWDIRDANFCYEETADHLTMIDVDSLAAFSAEILAGTNDWQQRNQGRQTALARLRRMAVRLILSQGQRPKKRMETQVETWWLEDLKPILTCLGCDAGVADRAPTALERFLERLQQSGVLRT